MKSLKIALLQLTAKNTIDDNLKKGLDACRSAKKMGADIALFPEMWSIGYNMPRDVESMNKIAISLDSVFVNSFGALAKELDMAIAITFLEKSSQSPKNTLCLFDRHGEKALVYSKVHTCDFDIEKYLTPGDDFYVTELNTSHGTVKVGAMICFDREFPESARILMLKGAEIILVPNACPMEINRLSQLRTRAYENMVGIATANYSEEQPDCNGHSTAFDGIAYRPSEITPRDTLIIEAGGREGIYFADFPIDDIREYRNSEVHGNAYRQPQKYKILVAEKIEKPFIRTDYRKHS